MINSSVKKAIANLQEKSRLEPCSISIAVKGGIIIGIEQSSGVDSVSMNLTRRYNTHQLSFSRHSEAVLLSRLPKSLLYEKSRKMSKVKIYNLRLTKSGRLKNSCSCTECALLLLRAGIKYSYYVNDKGVFIKDRVENIITYSTQTRGTKNVSKYIR